MNNSKMPLNLPFNQSVQQNPQSQIKKLNSHITVYQQSKGYNQQNKQGIKSQKQQIDSLSKNCKQDILNEQSRISQKSALKNHSIEKQRTSQIKQVGNSNQKSQSPLKYSKQSQLEQDKFLNELKKLSLITPTIKIFYQDDLYYEGEIDQQGEINGKGVMYNVLNTLFIPQPSFQWKRVEGQFINGKIDGKAIYYDNSNKEYKTEYNQGLFIRKLE